MKVLITGSHFTPAQAVIEKLLEISDMEIIYLGRKFARDDDKVLSVESQILPKLGVKFIPITAGKLNRFLSFQTVISFLKTPVGFIQAFYYLSKEKPDLIISFGGFAGLPVIVCGWFLSIPTLIHEQGLKMGLANLISSIFANKIAVSFNDFKIPALLKKDKVIVSGNPIRKEFLNPGKASEEIKKFVEKSNNRNKPLILITAGNQGSHFINLTLEDKLTELCETAAIIHQTGDSKFDDFSNLSKHQTEDYLVKRWIEEKDLSYILDNADLTVCRAGINTLSELALKSAPALMIPIPLGSEQTENALYFKKQGLGEVITEDKITPLEFLVKIREMLSKKSQLKNSAKKAKSNLILDADKKLMQEILLLKHQAFNFEKNF